MNEIATASDPGVITLLPRRASTFRLSPANRLPAPANVSLDLNQGTRNLRPRLWLTEDHYETWATGALLVSALFAIVYSLGLIAKFSLQTL